MMKKRYDFSRGKRGPVVPLGPNKTRITIRLDNDIVTWFRDRVNRAGGGNYQSLINEALHEHIKRTQAPIEDTLRRAIREELRKAG